MSVCPYSCVCFVCVCGVPVCGSQPGLTGPRLCPWCWGEEQEKRGGGRDENIGFLLCFITKDAKVQRQKRPRQKGWAGAGRVRPEPPAPTRRGHPTHGPWDIHSRVYMLGAGESQPADRGTEAEQSSEGGLHISVGPPSPLGGTLLKWGTMGQVDLGCQSPPLRAWWQRPRLCPPVPSGQEVRNGGLGWAGH